MKIRHPIRQVAYSPAASHLVCSASSICCRDEEIQALAQRSQRLLPKTRTTVAILSDNPLVGRALELLLESAGYEVRLLEEPAALRVGDSLDGVDIVLLGRGLGDGRREDFLSALASTLETATIPVLSFSPGPKGTRAEVDRLVPWPCRIEDLAREIEAALEAAEGDEPIHGSRTPAEEASA